MRLLCAALLSLALVSCEHQPHFLLGHLSPFAHTGVDDDSSSGTYVSTNLDQFDATNNAVFQQRYFVNSTYSTGKGYHFLLVGGEFTLSADLVVNPAYPHMQLAKAQGATVWALEHRYYGLSQPFTNNSVGNLTYLTSEQAVEDIAQFIRSQNSASGESNPKWILFGGSYSGGLALWARQKHADITAGVVASSAVANPTVDNFMYQKNIDDAYMAYSSSCYNAIASAALTARNLLQWDDGREQLSSALKLSPNLNSLNLTYNDLQFFEYMLASVFRVPATFNGVNIAPFNTGLGIASVCAIMTNVSQTDDLQRLTSVTSYVSTQLYGGFNSVYNNYTGVIALLKYDKAGPWSSKRVFIWQLCNEFGWFPTTDYGRGIFFSAIPNNLFLDMCQDVYGPKYTVDNLKRGINFTQTNYNTSSTFSGTNAAITVGASDPYRSLSINRTSDSSSTVYTVDAMAHCGDMMPVNDTTDSYGVKAVRVSVATQVQSWLTGTTSAKADEIIVEEHEAEKKERVMKPSTGEIVFNTSHPSLMKGKYRYVKKRDPYKFEVMGKASLHKHMRARVAEKERAKKSKGLKTTEESTNPYIMFGYIMQDLDHFDSSNTDKFQQFFFYNNEYRNQYTNTHFLMISGESYLDWFLVSPYLQMMAWARKWNATVYALEHRFYGYSQPKTSVATRYLKWLTVEQALADTATFIQKTNVACNYTSPKWVAFGGSYAGNLAAWFRVKYPDLTLGAVASSAPVQVKTDYFEYLQVVQNSTTVFGGKKCAANVKAFFTWAQQSMTTQDGRMEISEDFYLCDTWCEYYINEKDAELLQAYMIFFLSTYVQYDDEGHDYVEEICDYFADVDEDVGANTKANAKSLSHRFNMTKIAEFFRFSKYDGQQPDWSPDNSSTTGGGGSGVNSNGCTSSEQEDRWWCNDLSYDSLVEYYQITNTDWFDTSDRCWTWQACTEWGYHQSSNSGYNLFESTLPVNFAVDLCTDVFGDEYTRAVTDAGVRASNANYGGQDAYNGTNVVFVNGSEDPWHVLSVLGDHKPLNVNVTSILISGTSHCEDMYHQEKYDKAALKDARKQIKKVLKSWLD